MRVAEFWRRGVIMHLKGRGCLEHGQRRRVRSYGMLIGFAYLILCSKKLRSMGISLPFSSTAGVILYA